MADEFLTGTVGFLALLGVVALALRVASSLGRIALGAAEGAAARGMAEASMRRGDLTSLAEAQKALARARSRRRMHMAAALGWTAWILIPLGLGGLREAWALASPLWLLPRGKVRIGRGTHTGAVGNDPAGPDGAPGRLPEG